MAAIAFRTGPALRGLSHTPKAFVRRLAFTWPLIDIVSIIIKAADALRSLHQALDCNVRHANLDVRKD
ncbi:MAG: hypothetical protein R3C30_03815 [Hyphomonadaceae bacterium]